LLRKALIAYALNYGNKKAAWQFQTTVKTVRKWRKRWEEKKEQGLKTCLKARPVPPFSYIDAPPGNLDGHEFRQ